MSKYTAVQISEIMGDIGEQSILSRKAYQDDRLNVILFQFAAGEELSEHTAAKPIVIHILSGEGVVGIEGEETAVGPGSWFQLEANLPHSVLATSELTLLLYLLK